MADDWYCKTKEQEFGPMTSKALRKLVVKGAVKPHDQVKRGENGSWKPAESIKGLVPRSRAPIQDAGTNASESSNVIQTGMDANEKTCVVKASMLVTVGVLIFFYSTHWFLFGGIGQPREVYHDVDAPHPGSKTVVTRAADGSWTTAAGTIVKPTKMATGAVKMAVLVLLGVSLWIMYLGMLYFRITFRRKDWNYSISRLPGGRRFLKTIGRNPKSLSKPDPNSVEKTKFMFLSVAFTVGTVCSMYSASWYRSGIPSLLRFGLTGPAANFLSKFVAFILFCLFVVMLIWSGLRLRQAYSRGQTSK